MNYGWFHGFYIKLGEELSNNFLLRNMELLKINK